MHGGVIVRSRGNGAPEVCANNLMQIVRGEVPYERVKGLDPRLIDRPLPSAKVDVEQDAEWLISTYEPRVAFKGVVFTPPTALDESPTITAVVTEKED